MTRGDVRVLLSALGAREGEDALERAFAFVGGDPEIETFVDERGTATYARFPEQGVEFLLKDGAVSSVFIAASDTDDLRTYRNWQGLLPGVGPGATRDDVATALRKEPVRATEVYETYAVDGGYLQFEFAGDRFTMLVVMRQLVGDAAAPPPPAAGPGAVAGEVTIFLRALGQPMFSPAHLGVIELVGPASESRDAVIDGVDWQYESSPRAGVLLQFTQEILVGALIRLVDDGSGVYPSPDLLIDGLALPATRAAVGAFFGTPHKSRPDMDLYLVDEHYLRFDYADEVSTALTVIEPGVPA